MPLPPSGIGPSNLLRPNLYVPHSMLFQLLANRQIIQVRPLPICLLDVLNDRHQISSILQAQNQHLLNRHRYGAPDSIPPEVSSILFEVKFDVGLATWIFVSELSRQIEGEARVLGKLDVVGTHGRRPLSGEDV